jgi:hypothetical protein
MGCWVGCGFVDNALQATIPNLQKADIAKLQNPKSSLWVGHF